MASLKKGKFGSDDEDDLESLRLAALNTLKPKVSLVALKPLDINHGRPQNIYKQHPTFGAAQTTRNHNRGFRNNGGRIGRNGINPRIRNTNLISIQVIDETETKEPSLNAVVRTNIQTDAPKLILPQDRYYKTQTAEIAKEKESLSNKFDRYKNSSDESDSDSDDNSSIPAKRERKNSIDALMDDINNILEDKDQSIEVDEKKSESDDEKIDTDTINSQKSHDNEKNVKEVDVQKEANDTLIIEDIDPDIVQIIQNEEKSSPCKEEIITEPRTLSHSRSRSRSKSRSRSRSPYLKKSRSRSRSVKSRSKSPYIKAKSPPYRSPPRRSRSRSPIRKRYSPYSRPLPNLTINTDVLNTMTMAPLSPRSAAFVLENRQILARRQMSPRRSRSPGRRSPSPKRLKLSPRRRTRSRSRSPRFDPVRKCSLSPRKRSNSPKFSPKRRSTSPRNYSRRSPNFNRYNKRNSNSPVVKQSVHRRLGTKNPSPHDRKTEVVQKRKRTSRSISLSLSPSPDRNYHKRPLNETTGQVNENKIKRKENATTQKPAKEKEEDPILLARKKKFESPVQLGKNNGVIKLNAIKTKQTDLTNKDTSTDELSDAQQEESPEKECFNEGSDIEIELNTNLDDLWSDEESDNENEGRFKSKTSNKNSVQTISIRNLTEKAIPKESLLPRDRHDNFRSYSDRDKSTRLETMPSRTHSDRDKSTKRSKYEGVRRNKTSKSESLKTSSHEKSSKDRVSSKSKIRYEQPREKNSKIIADNIEKNKDINIETEGKEVLKTLQTTEDKVTSRRVKINSEPEVVLLECNTPNTDEPEIVIENDDDVAPKDDESDLRAEISRRRAERLQKAGSIAGALPTRLLKSALQEVVPKRTTTKTSNISKGSVNAADRKVLIIKSLASSPVTKVEPANKVIKSKKESGKLPIHMRLGQTKANVNDETCTEEVDGVTITSGGTGAGIRDRERGERRSKKSRPSKRKNRKVVQVPYNWFSICIDLLIFLLSIFTMALLVLSKCADIFQISIAKAQLNTGSVGYKGGGARARARFQTYFSLLLLL